MERSLLIIHKTFKVNGLKINNSYLKVIYLPPSTFLQENAKSRNIAVSNSLKQNSNESSNITAVRQRLQRGHSRQPFYFRGQSLLERGHRHHRHGGIFRLLGTGSSVRITPSVSRCTQCTGSTPLVYICIQAKEDSLTQYTMGDGVIEG